LDPVLATVISNVETFDFCPSSLISSSVPISMLLISRSLTKARAAKQFDSVNRSADCPSSRFDDDLFFASVEEDYADNHVVPYWFSADQDNVVGFLDAFSLGFAFLCAKFQHRFIDANVFAD
jgi:hypothetical protein